MLRILSDEPTLYLNNIGLNIRKASYYLRCFEIVS